MKKAYFAGGCFWCIAALISTINGVEKVISGYSGGSKANPTYEDVKSQKTGHRESIEVIYDENKTSYKEILEMFLNNIDPFDDEGQFIDRGFSYSPAIFYKDEIEKNEAINAIKNLEKEACKEVKVKIEEFKNFYAAEEFHQDYHLKHPKEMEEEFIKSGRKKF